MELTALKRQYLRRRHLRLRQKLSGTASRPRLAVFRSLKHIHAQLIDDDRRVTLLSASTQEKILPDGQYGGNMAAAKIVGQVIAQRAAEAGISAVIFDRGGRKYHGRVKALADAAREGGLIF